MIKNPPQNTLFGTAKNNDRWQSVTLKQMRPLRVLPVPDRGVVLRPVGYLGAAGWVMAVH